MFAAGQFRCHLVTKRRGISARNRGSLSLSRVISHVKNRRSCHLDRRHKNSILDNNARPCEEISLEVKIKLQVDLMRGH